jgi:hypothetical protein
VVKECVHAAGILAEERKFAQTGKNFKIMPKMLGK